jgi:hypothetical protein
MALNTNVTTVDPTVAQLGLAVGQLNQKIQQLSTQQAASTVTTNTAATKAVTTSSGSYTEVNPVVQILSSGTATTWTTIDLSPYIGSHVKRVVLNGYCKTSGNPDNVERELDFRADSNSVTRIACRIIGVQFSYSGEQSFYLECPVSSQSIQYRINTDLQTCQVWLVETFS